ncbi:MAG TPA: polysaccharide pyruvyl transferase family protein, partial [Thermodesulfovibrionales bacterium]|nr:polysaccharide pyruvyl transferase family protein [Thermodesulfovibrionales bacterium]
MTIALILPLESHIDGYPYNCGNLLICDATIRLFRRSGFIGAIEEFSYLKRPSEKELERINNCDAAIFAGTNIFQDRYPGWRWTIDDLQEVKIPYWLFGVSYSGALEASGNPAISREIHDLLVWAKGAEGIGVRDPRSMAWLASHKAGSELIGCPVLAYPEDFSGFMLGEGKPVLAVSKILLHVAGKEASKAQGLLVDRFFEKYPDGIGIAQSTPDLPLLEGRQTVKAIQEIVQCLSQACFVVSARLHSGMFALANGRPAIIISHDSRAASFCDMLSLPVRRLTAEGVIDALNTVRAIERGDFAEFDSATRLILLYRKKMESYVGGILSSTSRPKVKANGFWRIGTPNAGRQNRAKCRGIGNKLILQACRIQYRISGNVVLVRYTSELKRLWKDIKTRIRKLFGRSDY